MGELRLHFEPNLDYQLAAIESVCDLFRGQEIGASAFTTSRYSCCSQTGFARTDDPFDTGNRVSLSGEDILANLREVQLRNGLDPSDRLRSKDFTVEMETGTGKTYVYLRTIFEMHRRFGFTKFVIVVPSIAIKEGVCKTIRITEEHFRSLFANTPLEFFVYDSSKLGQVLHFATSPHIQIMVVTVGSINKKDVNNLYKDSEKTGSEKPIDLIRATRPILIVDEPQSVDGGLEGRGREALGLMNPLCTLRYSATHAQKHHMVFRLGAVDAFERRLVKQVEVASARLDGSHNTPYVRFLSARNDRGSIVATLELDVERAGAVIQALKTVRDGDDLERLTGRVNYANCRIGEIRCGPGSELIEVQSPGGVHWLEPGKAIGAIDEIMLKRLLIRRTIKEHLDKELRLVPLGIKVLSLFFIDRVELYRKYDASGAAHSGVYAEIFEEEYHLLAGHPAYRSLFRERDSWSDASLVHGGYFSQDRSGAWSDTTENTLASRESAERAYKLIMTDKEKLLSFETKLKFIFSHSALREGWDNPNVFQICALREIGTERDRRQTIGRGLRLCVNQRGERMRGFDINTLTVIATESYEQFAAELQKEFEQDTGITFEAARKLDIKNADRRQQPGTPAARDSEDLRALWDRIKDGTTFRVRVDNEVLLQSCARAIQAAPAISEPRLEWRKAELNIGKSGVQFKSPRTIPGGRASVRAGFVAGSDGASPSQDHEKPLWQTSTTGAIVLEDNESELPDLLTVLEDRTQLTRRSLARILSASKRLDDFKRNPQQFIEMASEAINRAKRRALGDGVVYHRTDPKCDYTLELFEWQELTDCLEGRLAGTAPIDAIEIYAELPGWFTLPTPVGEFSPGWALLVVSEGGAERVYCPKGRPGSKSMGVRLDQKAGPPSS